MIFVCEQMKRELCFLGEHIPVLLLSAFLAAAGGVVLWISGGSSWYFIRTASGSGVGLGFIFSVWILTYALVGALMALLWLTYSGGRRDFRKTMPLFVLVTLSYLFMLVWYALFFCTRLAVFSAVILILSCIIDAVVFFFMRKSFLLFDCALAVVFAVQTYFVYFSFSFS